MEFTVGLVVETLRSMDSREIMRHSPWDILRIGIILDIPIEILCGELYIRGQILRKESRLGAPMQQSVHRWFLGRMTARQQVLVKRKLWAINLGATQSREFKEVNANKQGQWRRKSQWVRMIPGESSNLGTKFRSVSIRDVGVVDLKFSWFLYRFELMLYDLYKDSFNGK